jgi:hypothetical protein
MKIRTVNADYTLAVESVDYDISNNEVNVLLTNTENGETVFLIFHEVDCREIAHALAPHIRHACYEKGAHPAARELRDLTSLVENTIHESEKEKP